MTCSVARIALHAESQNYYTWFFGPFSKLDATSLRGDFAGLFDL